MCGGLLGPFEASKENLGVSHLLFADGIILLSKVDSVACEAILEVLEKFCVKSGQKISSEKSRIYFSPNVNERLEEEVCDNLGIWETHDIGKYLGFPLRHRWVARNPYKFIVEKVMSKLVGWKTKYLSFAGWTVLIKFVMSAIPNYVMQGVALPVHICEKLDKVNRDFLWGSTSEKKRMHMLFGNRTDSIMWKYSKDGEFSTNSAYQLANEDDMAENQFQGQWLWKLDGLPKIISFLWLCVHGSIPMKSVLAVRGINCGKGGGGGVIRDCHGGWVKGFSRPIGHTTSVMAEWWALRDGLMLTIQLGIHQLEVELDAKVIGEILNSANYPNRSYATLMCDFRSLMARFKHIRVGHVFREANRCVDLLAKRGCSMLENFVMFDTSPFEDLNVLLDADMNGLYYYRHVANTLVFVASL
ncbi:uncharacterized protein LOC142639980 [Castanea sativa]|uniref:uncharacterized protein LOC142639980 n=1 Tax=Castanea sativa TaxID=21020 RepID=UPI003F65284E